MPPLESLTPPVLQEPVPPTRNGGPTYPADRIPQGSPVWRTGISLPLTPPPPLQNVPASPPVKRRKGGTGWRRVLLTVCLLLFVLGGGTIAYGYYYFNTNIQGPLATIIHPVSRGKDEPANNDSATDAGTITGRSWNILLLGSDDDGKYSFPAVLTQVMMIVHIDTVNNSVYMVSIPRDSWVYLPDIGGMHKIDQAFEFAASQHNSFDDGVREARLTVEKDYGITIDRYAWVGLSGFAKVIDTLGGIDIDVTHPIVDDTYPDDTHANPNDPYALERLYLLPGPQHLNGLQALEYVRSRHADVVGDIGRTERQQQVLEALKKKLNVTSVLTNLPQLITDLQDQVYTDLSEQEIMAFANYARGLPGSAIHRITLGPGVGDQDFGDFASVYDPAANAKQAVIIPNCAAIQPVINSIFSLGDVQSCDVTG